MMTDTNLPVEKCVRVAAALEQWAAEHSDQLSPETLEEVDTIAKTIRESSLDHHLIGDIGHGFSREIGELFDADRADRARTLIDVVAASLPKQTPPATPPPAIPSAIAPPPPDLEPPVTPADTRRPRFVDDPPSRTQDQVAAPAFLRSDMVDEEDDMRLYGPKRRWRTIVGVLLALTLLAGAAIAGWWWFTQRSNDVDTTVTEEPVAEVTAAPTDNAAETQPSLAPTVVPTATPEPAPDTPAFWADTGPILNSGSAAISASTYSVSPSNRAVLTGHTAAITGLAISNDGRVLTSGADRRLVDWGADVTLANPDVLTVPSPLTVLERTADQRLILGDSTGNVTIIDLVDTAEPIVIDLFGVAIAAAAELIDGRIAVASADGNVDVFDIDTPDQRVTLPHSAEVTAVAAMDDGGVATAAIDGVIRIWAADGSGSPLLIETLNSPATALIQLSNNSLAFASVDGNLQVVPLPAAAPLDVIEFEGHFGAIRALFEVTMSDGTLALASGGDDTTIRLWDLATQAQMRVLEGHGDIISAIDALPDGRLVTTSGDGTGRVWDLSVEPSRAVIPPHELNLSAIHAWNNDQIVTGSIDGTVVLDSTAVDSEPLTLTRHTATIVGIDVLDNGDIVSLDASSLLRISQPSGDPSRLVEIGLTPGATSLDVAESLGIVTGHADGTVRLHDFSEEVAAVDAHQSGVNDVTILSNGLVASAGQDMTVRITDFANPDQLRSFELHTEPVDVVIEMPDGRIASAGSDGIYLHSVDGSAQDSVRLNGQRSRTLSLVALPGDRLLSTGEDGRVRLWDLTQPESEPITLIDIPGVVNPYLIQADNGLFVAGAARGYVVFTLS